MLRYTYDPPYNQWYGIKNKNLLRFKVTYGGTVATASDLPPRGFMPGVMFNVQEDGSNYMWNGLTWDKMDSNPFVGATSSKDGIQGLVPEPKVANREGFLYGGGGWKNLDASDVKTGVFALARIPAAATERLVQVADQTERYALTTSSVQNGDTVLQQDTHTMYRVVDQTKLDEADGYVAYQAATAQSVAWGNITETPLTFAPSAHTHPWSEVTSKPSTYTPSEHTHECEDITDLVEIIPQNIYIDSVNGNDTNTGHSADNALKTITAFRAKIENSGILSARIINVYLAEGIYNESLAGDCGVCIIYRAPTTSGKAATVKDIVSAEGANIVLLGNYICGNVTVGRNGYLRFGNNCSITFDRDLYSNANTPGNLIFVYQNATCIVYSGSSITFNIKGNWVVSNGIYHIMVGSVLCFWGSETWHVLEDSSITGPQYRVEICSVGDGLSSSSFPNTGTAGYVDATSHMS